MTPAQLKELADQLHKEAGNLGDKARVDTKLSYSQAIAALVLDGIAKAVENTAVMMIAPVKDYPKEGFQFPSKFTLTKDGGKK